MRSRDTPAATEWRMECCCLTDSAILFAFVKCAVSFEVSLVFAGSSSRSSGRKEKQNATRLVPSCLPPSLSLSSPASAYPSH